ncbi:uncharacterized protein A1O5_07351 [Cladophialophora psammophila CBS 110553]|uniref:Uncharacterized protein n=1 Tax=Cladophialophora psammophila CBS 110553 TaxID=1182543 RepID=W9WW78_9EURO|nr:uncharacterized protein A1O5_07351 [Cladophialophora psammophila CBS 110553]EXJ69315.1 hypothetical protein A1O5_07351 [Cladophialophora psammophila CBS 110553]
MTCTLEHPTLGKIQGNANSGVTQFLNVKYAALSHRFGCPVLYEGAGSSGVIDATKIGPAAIAGKNSCYEEFALI